MEALNNIICIVFGILTVINCIFLFKLNVCLKINNYLNKNNINHDDTNKLSINNNSITININLISIIKKVLILIQVNITYSNYLKFSYKIKQ